MNKIELKKDIKKLCENLNPKKIDLLFWLDLEVDIPQLEIQIEVHNEYDDSKYYCLEVLEAGEHAEEFNNYKNLTEKQISKYKQWLNWLKNVYYSTYIEEVKEIVHI